MDTEFGSSLAHWPVEQSESSSIGIELGQIQARTRSNESLGSPLAYGHDNLGALEHAVQKIGLDSAFTLDPIFFQGRCSHLFN